MSEEKKLVGDEHMGAWVYCNQHLQPHSTGWCGVSPRNKFPLQATTYEEACAEVESKGWHVYNASETGVVPEWKNGQIVEARRFRHSRGNAP